jgi:hypothetical protein
MNKRKIRVKTLAGTPYMVSNEEKIGGGAYG